MRIRTGILAASAAVLLTLTACGSDDEGDSSAPPTKTTEPSADMSEALEDAGIPAEPEGAKREALLAALKVIDPALVADEEKAIDAARNQCSSLNGGADNVDSSAAQRFSTGDLQLDEAQGRLINAALKQTLC